MGIKRYKAEKDTTIVNAYQPDFKTRATGANAGKADVVEVFSIYGRITTSSQELSRTLIQFPITDVSSDRTAGTIPASGSVSFYLRMFNAEHSKTVPEDYTLTVLAVSQSWQEGVGLDLERYKDETKGNTGANWMSASNTAYWTDINGSLLQGGSYLTGGLVSTIVDTEIHTFTQTFSTGLEDLEINITPLVEQWIDSTYSNYGVGIKLSASYEAFSSASANTETGVSRVPRANTLDPLYKTNNVIYNPSGSTKSYYTKRFFASGSQYFFRRPVIEARWNSATKDQRGNFYYSSSLAAAADNVNTIYLYNYVHGKLTDIPDAYGGTFKKRLYVSIYSGSVGGFYPNQGGGDGDDVAPSNYPVSGTTSTNTGSVQILTVDNDDNVTSVNKLVVTGGIVSTGIYSASFAFTGSELLETIYDVWFTGSHKTTSANDALIQYFTGAVKPITLRASQTVSKPVYYGNITNLRKKYRKDETARFNLYVRNKNWSPTVYTVANSTPDNTTIVSASYRVFRTMDAYGAVSYGTGSDLHTQMSYDVSGSYFDFDMNLLEPGYEYAFKFAFYDSALSTWIEQPDAFKFRVEDYEY
jgi:hypothetical protein